jgi:hypothetical protein
MQACSCIDNLNTMTTEIASLQLVFSS